MTLSILFLFTALSTTFVWSSTQLQNATMCELLAKTNGITLGWRCDSAVPRINVCKWKGVTCDSNGLVAKIFVPSSNIRGFLPSSIGQLSSLTGLFLSYNSFEGIIPTSIGFLTKLLTLELFGNKFSGSIPSTFGKMSSLTMLDLRRNSLKGPIPETVGDMFKLVNLHLGSNSLTDSIPYSLGSSVNLQSLSVAYNSISGIIPGSLYQLSNLIALEVQFNAISGTIPNYIFTRMPHLKTLYLDDNYLSSTIPSLLGYVSSLIYLALSNNLLTGIIPTSIGNLSQLKALSVALCRISSLISLRITPNSQTQRSMSCYASCLSTITYNDFHFVYPICDTVQPAVMKITAPHLASIASEYFKNQDKALCDLYEATNIGYVTDGAAFCMNKQPIDNVCKWPGMTCIHNTITHIQFPANVGLNGSLPSSIGLLTNLIEFYIFKNELTGSLPTSIGLLHKLEILFIEHNLFTGDIPSTIGNIPSDIGKISLLQVLVLSSNSLEGNIPDTIGNLTHLQELALGYNFINGIIPEVIESISSESAWIPSAYTDKPYQDLAYKVPHPINKYPLEN
eukprot:gene8313-17111_t